MTADGRWDLTGVERVKFRIVFHSFNIH